MDSVRDLKRLLYERTETLKQKDELVEKLERTLNERDATIQYLQNEIDKFRQIVDLSMSNGALGTRQRFKRLAISAEPLRNDTKPIVKFNKPTRY